MSLKLRHMMDQSFMLLMNRITDDVRIKKCFTTDISPLPKMHI